MKNTKVRLAEAVASYKDCPPNLSQGVTKFAEALTPSHSLTSRRYSIWRLLRLHVDGPFAEALCYRGVWHKELLTGFMPSRAGRHPGAQVLAAMRTYEPLKELADAVSEDERSSTVTAVTGALECWFHCLRMAIHSVYVAGVREGGKPFIQSLDLLRELLQILEQLRPRYRTDPTFGRTRVTSDGHYRYCELCWRLSMRSIESRRASRNKSKRLPSGRFCAVHDPSNPKSRYRTDLNYKKAFYRELGILGNLENGYAFELPALPHPDFAMLRRLAYDRVHAGIRSPNSRSPLSLKERVWKLRLEGLRQSEIARTLGISRQAVSKTMKQLRSIWDEHCVRLRSYHLS